MSSYHARRDTTSTTSTTINTTINTTFATPIYVSIIITAVAVAVAAAAAAAAAAVTDMKFRMGLFSRDISALLHFSNPKFQKYAPTNLDL